MTEEKEEPKGSLKEQQAAACKRFRENHPHLFQKNDALLFFHLAIVILLLGASTAAVILTPILAVKIVLGTLNMFLLLSLADVTIHHHHTHHNAADRTFAQKTLEALYFLLVPAASRRKKRYVTVHLNHHSHALEPTDIDHLYGIRHFLRMNRDFWHRTVYFLELTFIGGHVPGWEDARYMESVPVQDWNLAGYEKIKQVEVRKARWIATFHWGSFFVAAYLLPWFAWGWFFPFLFLKNWAHYLGQFQHYDQELFNPQRTVWNRAKTYHFPRGLNYLLAGEISGHFLHHLFPTMPYYHVERARALLVKDPELNRLFVYYGKDGVPT